MTRSSFAGRAALAAALVALPACFVAPSADTVAALGAVEAALESPTGVLDADSAPEVLAISTARVELDRTSAYTRHLADGLATTPQGAQSMPASCKTSSETGGSLDVACASQGAASGVVTYTVSLDASGKYVVLVYDAVCSDGVCIDGTASSRVSDYVSESQHEMVGSASLDITEDGATRHADYGFRSVVQDGDTVTDWVVFDAAGASFVLSAVVSAESGDVTVRDHEGTMSCHYEQGGETGSCVGPSAVVAW